MKVVAIVGLPGSGKTRLMAEYASRGYHSLDEIQNEWPANLIQMVELLEQGKCLVVASCFFCRWLLRREFEIALGLPVQWIFFANDPYRCARNAVFRRYIEQVPGVLELTVRFIEELTPVYHPPESALPIVLADRDS